jgi:hypothetical protein
MSERVLSYTATNARKWVKLDSEHRYKHVLKLVETGYKGGIKRCKPDLYANKQQFQEIEM